MVRCDLCGFLNVKPQTALHHAMYYYLRCGAVVVV